MIQDVDSTIQVPPATLVGEICEGVRYLERRRPSATPEEVVHTLPVPSGTELVAMTPPRLLVTDEGEYAALVVVDSLYEEQLVRRAIGIVHVDDFDAVTIGHTRRPEAFAEMEQLVEKSIRTERHFMSLRRRPYRCSAPPSWSVEPAAMFSQHWRSLDGERSIMTWPALPLDGTSAVAAVERMLGFDVANGESTTVLALGGLRGHRFLVHAECCIEVAILVDHRFVYAASYEGPWGDDGTFAALVDSIEPIPRDRWQDKAPVALVHWVD